jgi:D-sedoheptulose 7-phosphate isomerase
MNTRRTHITDYLDTLRRVLDELSVDAIENVTAVLERVYHNGGTIFICGNGGSAAASGHWACDFAKGTVVPNARRLRAMSLADNLAILTAYANDLSYDQVFSEPLRTYARTGDVVVLITASGNSPNILEAAKAARDLGVTSIGLIGFGGGKLASMVDHQITVSCREYGPVEDLHMVLDHIMSTYLRTVIMQTVPSAGNDRA